MSDVRRARFEAEVLVHLSAAHHAAYHLTRSADAARDVTQEAVLRAYRTFDGFTEGTNAKAWLLTIVYSVFVNRYRRNQRVPEHVSIEELEARHAGVPAAVEPVPADPFIGPWTEPEVADALAALPGLFRDTVLLVDVEELTYEEAATALGCAVGTVRSRLFRARRVLAAALEPLARRRGLIVAKGESR